MNTVKITQDRLENVAHSLGDIATDGGELVADLATDLVEVAEAAVSAVATISVVAIRALGRAVSFAARRPREVIGGVVAVAAVLAVLGYLRSRSDESTTD